MPEPYFESADELKNIFNIDSNQQYTKFMPLRDRRVGFSVQREYPTNIRYIPPKTKDNKPDTVALIHIVYTHPNETKKAITPNKVPLVITITHHSRYISNHFDYNFDDEECPTLESIEISKSTTKPISLDFIDEFFYNHERKTIVDNNGKIYSGEEVINHVFDRHCDTFHWFKGLKLRYQIRLQNLRKVINLLYYEICIEFYKKLLIGVFGRTLEPKDHFSVTINGYEKGDLKILNTDVLVIFGYKAPKNLVIIFCISSILLYSYCYLSGIKNKYFEILFTNTFLSTCTVIFLMFVMNNLIPNYVFWSLNKTIRRRFEYLTKNRRIEF